MIQGRLQTTSCIFWTMGASGVTCSKSTLTGNYRSHQIRILILLLRQVEQGCQFTKGAAAAVDSTQGKAKAGGTTKSRHHRLSENENRQVS